MLLQGFCLSVVYALKFKINYFMMYAIAWDVSNPLLENIFWVLFWLKCIKCWNVLPAIDEDFYLIIPVLVLLRTIEIYYMFMGELKFKKHFVITDAHVIF